jgi:hypothetical protein
MIGCNVMMIPMSDDKDSGDSVERHAPKLVFSPVMSSKLEPFEIRKDTHSHRICMVLHSGNPN